FESSLWLGYYYYSEGELEKAAALFEETLARDVDALEAKFLLEKIRNGDSGPAGKSGGRMQSNDKDSGQKQGFVARLIHRTKGPMK
ncbi:MAG: hypothetical protein K2N39_09715, partial [Lachnospiraceae bacterium]|nr:hypothetical protein [Lachnospiraceae bacterium]